MRETSAGSKLQRAARWLARGRSDPLFALAVAAGCVLLATLLRVVLEPVLGTGYSFVTYFLAVIVAATTTGFLGGAAALALALAVAWYLFVPPVRSFEILNRRDATALVVFVVNAGLSGLVAATLRSTVSALLRAEDRQQLLINELNHRVKNTLATVQSIALQTARTSRSYEEFQPLFSSRLAALASAHDLLTRRNWEGAELGGLLREVVAAYDPDGDRISASGPPVSLSPNAAVTLSLALHELATNAVKHGALGGAAGRVDATWSLEGGRLHFEWRESGGPVVGQPGESGFGARLLKAVARELEAEVTAQAAAEGMTYHWRLPLTGKLSAA